MDPKEALEIGKKSVLKHGELFAKGVIEDCFAPAVKVAQDALGKAIPGQIDDAIIAKVVENFAPALKEAMLAEVSKLSDEV
jgi:hypothetical protein